MVVHDCNHSITKAEAGRLLQGGKLNLGYTVSYRKNLSYNMRPCLRRTKIHKYEKTEKMRRKCTIK